MSLSGTVTDMRGDGRPPAERLLERLEKVKARGAGKWMACCPAHEDRTPSLSISEEADGKLLIHCFAGCPVSDVLAAVELTASDLFPDDPGWHLTHHHRPRDPAVDMAEAVVDMAHANIEAGMVLDDGDRQQLVRAMKTLVDAGIRPAHEFPDLDNPKPRPVPQPQFLATNFPPEDPILGPFKSQQLALIYAPTGAGKSMLALAMAAAMAEGVDFLKWKASGAKRVLYIDGEMSAWELQTRLKGVNAPNLYLASSMAMSMEAGSEPLNLATPAGQARLMEWVKELQIDVVYLDNLMCLSFVPGASINSDESWRPVNKLCLALRFMGILVVVIDHANQTGAIHGTKTKGWHVNHMVSITPIEGDEPDDFDVFSGRISAGTARRARVVWQKHRGTPEKAENGGTLTDEFVVTLGDIGTAWDVETGDAAMKRRAIEMKKDGISIREIADELMVSKSKVGRWTRGVK